MNLTPSHWENSEVTKYSKYVKAGMRLRAEGSEWATVQTVDSGMMLVRFDNDPSGEFDEWLDMTALQIGWNFEAKDRRFIFALEPQNANITEETPRTETDTDSDGPYQRAVIYGTIRYSCCGGAERKNTGYIMEGDGGSCPLCEALVTYTRGKQ